MTSRTKLAMTDHQHEDHHEHHHHEGVDGEESAAHMTPAHIFDAAYPGERVPEGFDAVRIPLDGSVTADLSWKKEREAAIQYVKEGRRLFWDIDFGIPGALPHSLSHHTQFLSLTLSLDHFRDTLWKDFCHETIGLCLYRGSPDFTPCYPWDPEQIRNLQAWLADLFKTKDRFERETAIPTADLSLVTPECLASSPTGKLLLKVFCRNAIAEYLTLLSAHVSAALPLFLLFDLDDRNGPIEVAQLVSKELYARFLLGIKSFLPDAVHLLDGDLAWEEGIGEKGMIGRERPQIMMNENRQAGIGICLPHDALCLPSHLQGLKETAAALQSQHVPFHIISQRELTAKWEGLDELVVSKECVDSILERQLRGFRAAGGLCRMV